MRSPDRHPPPSGALATAARLVTARPWATVVAAGVLTAAALVAALQLKPATGVQDMLADDQPSAIAFGKMVDRYALVDDLVLIAELPEASTEPTDQPPSSATRAPHGVGVERLIGFARLLERGLNNEPLVASVRYRPAADARAFVEEVVVPRGWDYLDPAGRDRLTRRLTRDAMDDQFAQNAAMLAAPGPAAGRLARELIRDPLRLRDFLAGRGGDGKTSGFRTLPGVDANVSADGRAVLINIAGVKPASDLDFTADFMPQIRRAVQLVQMMDSEHPPLDVLYTGAYAIAEHSAGQTRADMIASCTGSVILLIGGFLLVYRHPLAFPVLLLPVYMAIVWAFGLYAVSAGHLTPVTAVTGAVLAGLGIDYCVHYVAAHELERRRAFRGAGLDDRDPGDAANGLRRVATLRAVAHVGPAIVAAALTTVLGFGAVMLSHVRALREFAALGVVGLIAALITALFVLPPLLLALGRTPFARGGLSATRFSIAPAVGAVARAPRAWLAFTVLLVLAAAATLGVAAARDAAPLRFDRDLHALHPRPHPALDAQAHLAERFGAAPNGLTLLVESDTPDNMLALAHAVQRRFAGERLQALGLSGVTGPAALLPDPARANDVRPDPARVVADLQAAADAAGFRAGAFDDYAGFLTDLLTPKRPPTFADVRRYPSIANLVLPKVRSDEEPEPSQGLVLATLRKPWADADERDHVIETVRDELADLNAGPDSAVLSGISVLGYDTQQAIAGGLGRLLALSGGAVLLWLLIFFRRPGDVLLALSPAAGGLTLMLAVVWLTGGSFNLINLIAVPLLVGIGVDDGIFLTALYRRARRVGESAALLRDDLAASAHAIGMTSATTALAFGSLYFTHVPAIKSLGLMVGVGVGGALLVSVCGLVPLLVLLFGTNQSAERKAQSANQTQASSKKR